MSVASSAGNPRGPAVYGIASQVRAVVAPFANNPVRVRVLLGALFASGLGLAICVALVTSRTLDVVDDGAPAPRFVKSLSIGATNNVLPSGAYAGANGAAMIDARDLREAIDELAAEGLVDRPDLIKPNEEGETEPPVQAAIVASRPPEETSSTGTEEPDRSVGPRKRVQRRAKSIAQRDSSSKYHQVPKGTEKMFDANWQSKAFAFE